jgi:hypothetical protein
MATATATAVKSTAVKSTAVNESVALTGRLYITGFLTDFSWFHYKANMYVEEIISDYLKMDMRVIDDRAVIFTYFEVYDDGTEKDDLDLETGFVRRYGDGYAYEELVHWGVDITRSNTERTTFYVHYEDWDALYCYLSVLMEDSDKEYVEFEISNSYLKINEEFVIRLYN